MTRAAWAAFALVLAATPARAQEAGPLRLLIQGDAGLWPSPPDAGFMRLRRLRVGDELSGHDLHARVLFEGQPRTIYGQPPSPLAGGQLPFGGPVRVTEAFVGWAPHRAFEVDAGALRVPFSLSRQIDEADLPLPERPGFVESYTPDFRTGVAVGGDLGEILYRAAVFSSDQTVDGHIFDSGYLLAGRLVAEPIGPVGLRPWRRTGDDPWFAWFRFAAGLSVLYGTLAAPQTLAVDPDFTAQWRRLVVSAEYFLSMRLGSGRSFQDTGVQGAVVEPGLVFFPAQRNPGQRELSFFEGQRYIVARAEWQRAGAATTWGAGGALTAYAPDPRWRLSIGYERRWATVAPYSGYWLITRLSIAID